MQLLRALVLSCTVAASLPLRVLGATKDDPEMCTVHSGNDYYDLRPLRMKKDFEVMTEVGARNITMNVCGPVLGETWHLDDHDNVAGYFRGPHSDLSIGKVNTTVSVVHGHPILIFSGGSECPKTSEQEQGSESDSDSGATAGSGIKRSTLVRFICDRSVFSRGTPKLIGQLPSDDDTACAFFIEWRTHLACPTHKPGGAWGPIFVFLSIIFITVAIYIGAAIFYNRVVLGLRGREQLPSFSLSGLASLKDTLTSCFSRSGSRRGLSFSGDGQRQRHSWGSWQGRDRNGFGRLPTSEEEEGMLGEGDHGRFSIDEEDEGAHDNQLLASGIPPPAHAHTTNGAQKGDGGTIRL